MALQKPNCAISYFLIGLFTLPYHVTAQSSANTIHDHDGNAYTFKTMADHKHWMTTNLNLNIPASYCYENEERNCKHEGRLYTWQSAQEGCRLLGEGWRLPTNEEWQQMLRYYGGVRGDSKDSGKAAYQALVHGGYTGFNISYGGTRDSNGTFRRQNGHGFYWTATESDSSHAWLYNFGINAKFVNRHQDGEKQRAVSVRCVRDINKLKEQ